MPSTLSVVSQVRQDDLASAGKAAARVEELANRAEPPSVTVVAACYNHRAFALELLDRLAQQSYASFEVVLVDDGSADGSFEALVTRARELSLSGRIVGLTQNRGRAVARNAGVLHSRGEIIAFTDADCLPAAGWLEAGVKAFDDPAVGMVQGITGPAPHQPRPFFNHFISIPAYDGTFSTCNAFYRRAAFEAAGGFDGAIEYWEDVDLACRALRTSWKGAFAPEAVVYHQVIPLTPARWLRWPLHFRYVPAKVAAYPEYRRHLFLGIWVDWLHALFDLALVSLPLALVAHPAWLLLAAPYLVAFPLRRGLNGRWPPLKAALHVAWDVFSFAVLVAASIRHRSLVL